MNVCLCLPLYVFVSSDYGNVNKLNEAIAKVTELLFSVLLVTEMPYKVIRSINLPSGVNSSSVNSTITAVFNEVLV